MTEQKTYLGDRTKYFGASDMPAMRGNCDFTSREQLIAKKKGDLGSFIEDTHFIDRGNEYEDVVYNELLTHWTSQGITECESQKTFKSPLLRATAHLDGYFVEYTNNKMIVHIYEIKSKTVDTKTDFQDLADGFKANPPVKYLDQMELQYLLAKLELERNHPGVDIEFKMHLIIGLYRGKSSTCTGTVEIDVTDIITSINIMDLGAEIINFWGEVDSHDGKYTAATALEIERVNSKKAYAASDVEYTDVELSHSTPEHEEPLALCQDYQAYSNQVARLTDELSETKKDLKRVESMILKSAKSTKSIDCGTFKLEIIRGVDNGRYTSEKVASYSSPKKFEKIKLISLGE